MKAMDFINENLDPIKVLEYYHFREIVETDDQIRCCCEIHKGNNPSAFMWKKSNNLWYCYTGTCHGGDVYTLVQKMEGVDFTTAVARTAEILGIDITGMTIDKQNDLIKTNTLKWLQFMQSSKSHIVIQPCYQLPYTQYTDSLEEFNRFDKEVIEFYQAKFCKVYPIEDSLLYNKLVIPLEMNGVLYGVALRATDERKPKWLYQPKHLKIRELLYNYDLAMQTIVRNGLTELILVEGIFDVWAYHNIGIDNVVAIFGSSLKKEQVSLILKSAIDLVLSFDNDDAGNKCTNEVLSIFKNKADMKTVPLPNGTDPADCKPEDLLQYYLARR